MNEHTNIETPVIYNYFDYRSYLQDMYAYLKETERGFSYRKFSERAGLKSPSAFQRVASGGRNLTAKAVRSFIKGLRLERAEADFFERLVRFGQAEDEIERDEAFRHLTAHHKFRKRRELEANSYEFYSEWYYVPIWEMIRMEGFVEDPEWIAGALRPTIRPSDAARALKTLKQLGLIERNANGRLVQTEEAVNTSDEVQSILVRGYQRSISRLALESIDRFSRPNRHVSSVTVAVTQKQQRELLDAMHDLRRRVVESLSTETDGEEKDVVMEITLHAFPIAEREIEKKQSTNNWRGK